MHATEVEKINSSEREIIDTKTTATKIDTNFIPSKKESDRLKLEKTSIEKELEKLEEDTKRIISENQIIPTYEIDTFISENLISIDCKDINLSSFTLDFIEEYEESSSNTMSYDGQVFCLKEIYSYDGQWAKIIFSRNEGGHTSDMLSFISYNSTLNKTFYLPLAYSSMSDGHELKVESKIEGNLITRIITNRYGWSNLDEESLSKQARRRVTQQISYDEKGVLKTIEERAEKFNY